MNKLTENGLTNEVSPFSVICLYPTNGLKLLCGLFFQQNFHDSASYFSIRLSGPKMAETCRTLEINR